MNYPCGALCFRKCNRIRFSKTMLCAAAAARSLATCVESDAQQRWKFMELRSKRAFFQQGAPNACKQGSWFRNHCVLLITFCALCPSKPFMRPRSQDPNAAPFDTSSITDVPSLLIITFTKVKRLNMPHRCFHSRSTWRVHWTTSKG